MGKALDKPACQLLGGVYESKILCTYTLSIDTPDRMAEQALVRKRQGYKTLVVKLGREPGGDIERLRLVREAVGDDVNIRLDANEAYWPDQAIRIIRQMEKFRPEFVEEPVAGIWTGWRRSRRLSIRPSVPTKATPRWTP
jgi:L-alanine-DL-glutamate epimerase-like enolase superfamily enzyme